MIACSYLRILTLAVMHNNRLHRIDGGFLGLAENFRLPAPVALHPPCTPLTVTSPSVVYD